MRKLTRLSEPAFLLEHWESWGKEWAYRHEKGGGAKFHWHEVGGQSVNKLLLPILKAQTQNHCSFCDNFPVSPPSIDTIEHFRPKSLFPLEAFRWTNLYYCCMACQQKGDKFSDKAIRPDEVDYSFSRYFVWDYTEGLLRVNSQASAADQDRAAVTIEIYGLNNGHPSLRRRELLRRSRFVELPLDDFGYRDYVQET